MKSEGYILPLLPTPPHPGDSRVWLCSDAIIPLKIESSKRLEVDLFRCSHVLISIGSTE